MWAETHSNPYWATVNLLKGQNKTNKGELHRLTGINGHLNSKVNTRTSNWVQMEQPASTEPVGGPISPAATTQIIRLTSVVVEVLWVFISKIRFAITFVHLITSNCKRKRGNHPFSDCLPGKVVFLQPYLSHSRESVKLQYNEVFKFSDAFS